MKRYSNFLGIASILAAVVWIGQAAPPKQGSEVYISPKTNKVVREPFVGYFLRTGGEAQYGAPITNDYVESSTGLLVQYFEKARLEWHPANPDPYKVQLGLLAQEMGYMRPPPPLSSIPRLSDPACKFFDVTGHIVCDEFLNFWIRNGGLDRFGYPITAYTFTPDGYLGQYFQRAVMVYRPEKPLGQRMVLEDLGSAYYRWANLDPGRLPNSSVTAGFNDGVETVTALQARASVFSAVAVAGAPQTVFVYVTNQLGNAQSGVSVTLVVTYPHGNEVFTLPPTSASGTSFQSFVVPEVKAGTIVAMEFLLTIDGVSGTTRTSYMVWY